jgi:hypothetical protein
MTCTDDCIHPSQSQAHCGSGCHRSFGGVSGFDAHRRGGRCVDPATITKDGGMHLDANGIWRWNLRVPNPHADSRRERESQTAAGTLLVVGDRSGRSNPAESRSGEIN